jgi:hypothetical protein
MNDTLFSALAIIAVAVAGCGGDFCSRQSPCPNDVRSTPAEIDQCRAVFDAHRNAPCFQLAVAHGECQQSSKVCTSGGTTDMILGHEGPQRLQEPARRVRCLLRLEPDLVGLSPDASLT